MNISQYYMSEKMDVKAIDIVVTIPTFKRPKQIVETLQSLIEQCKNMNAAVIVMENHDELEGAKAAANYMREYDMAGLVIVAHDRGNCHAYNAGWSTALTTFPDFKYLAVIDDDEIADPDWLFNLKTTLLEHHADFVGAPQIPQYAEGTARHWREHPVFKPAYDITGPVDILYSSGNVMMRREVLETMPQPHLSPIFNFIGGGDSDFYRRSQLKGFAFAWCHEAPVFEDIPERRTQFSWVHARSLRNGAISTMIEHRMGQSRAKTILKSLLLLAASPIRGAKLGIQNKSLIIGLYHTQVAIGRLMAEFGLVNEQYRNPEQN